MTREKRKWHPRFVRYMDFIIHHENYKGLCIEKKADGTYKWIVTTNSKIGQKRKIWCQTKARELGFPIQPGVYADVMLAIHPTKWKVCQTCGKKMSLYYHYPNANFLKSLNKTFNCTFSECDHISDIWDKLIKNGVPEAHIATFLIKKGNLKLPYTSSKKDIIDSLELTCRKGNKKCLGPGAMSNFPDRYDGFHTYNRCCRALQDKGRSKENLKSYTKDRRAYEYWSDGNIHAANQFMGSTFFTGSSADHIGPISLGFIHDSHYLQPMTNSDNSSKRDRLQLVDIEKIIETEKRTKIYPMSWYSRLIWDYICINYKSNIDKIAGAYRDALKQNMANFMYILWIIIEECPNDGELFLTEALLRPKYECFKYSYEFNNRGEIINKTPRHFTERNLSEFDRYRRIAIDAIYDYNDKSNRNTTPYLTKSEIVALKKLCEKINVTGQTTICKPELIDLVEMIEKRLIKSL